MRLPTFGILLMVCWAWGLGMVNGGRAQASAGGSGGGAEIRPTVTMSMGDRGGTFFGEAPEAAKVRRYYIAAEPELWDYAPQGRDPICGKPLPPPVVSQRKGGMMRYIQYRDENFATRVTATERLGVMGPVMRGVVGDFLVVTFLNRTGRPLSMHPHGVKYDKDSEGSYYQPKPGLGAAVGPGAKFTYVWKLDEDSGPMEGEPSSKGWLYHSHVEGDDETERGLVGFVVVTDPKRARADGTPSDVDRELAALLMIHDESGVGLEAKEAAEYGNAGQNMPVLTFPQIQERMEQGARHAINGYIFGNAPGLEAKQGERVRWYLFGLGSERDFHSAHWHGLRVKEEGRRRTDVVELLPASMKVADMVAENPGTWLFHCHVAEHMMEGMFARFVVHPASEAARDENRSLREPFFGMDQGRQSMEIRHMEATVDSRVGSEEPCVIRMSGSVTVFQAFSVLTQAIEVEWGGEKVVFRPDQSGRSRVGDAELRVMNGGQYGVVYGGVMEFEMTLRGRKWREVLEKVGGKRKSGEEWEAFRVGLRMKVGKAEHELTVPLRPKWVDGQAKVF